MKGRFFRIGAVLAVASAAAPGAWAMPQFARKYSMDCTGCHTTIPRLNEFGFQFRKAGFRMPNQIGEAQKNNFEDTFTARIQARYDYTHRNDSGKTTNRSQLTFHEVTLYPLSASFGKHYSSLMELSILGEDFVEIENAYFRYTRGREDAFFSGRVGIFHPFEGYGASDRPYSINRPFIQGTVANHNGSTFFTPWGFDQAGLELAYVHKRTSVSATLFNGLVVKDDEGAFKAFPAAGGELVKAGGFSKTNSKDLQVFVNQILRDDGSGISGYFYYGNTDLPIPGTAAEDFGPSTSFGNKFYRGALYGSWMLVPKVGVQAAYQVGQDHFFSPATASSSGTFKSQGWFAELDFPVSPRATLGGRFDQFDPSKDKANNKRSGVTAFANLPFNDGWQFIAEYRHIAQQRAGKADLKDDNFQVRMIWIW